MYVHSATEKEGPEGPIDYHFANEQLIHTPSFFKAKEVNTNLKI